MVAVIVTCNHFEHEQTYVLYNMMLQTLRRTLAN